jgi:hypothetical protein
MKSDKLVAALLLALLAAPLLAEPTEVVDAAGRGRAINWTSGLITAVGYAPAQPGLEPGAARLAQRRVALVDAYRQLAETARGVVVSSETRVEHLQLVDDTIRTELSTMIQGQVPVKEWYEPDGIYAVQVVMPIWGPHASLAGVVFPGLARDEKQVEERRADPNSAPVWHQPPVPLTIPGQPPAPTPPQPQPQPPTQPQPQPTVVLPPVTVPVTPVKPPVSTPQNKPGPYTGLVVDCRQFELERSMSPKILTGDGKEVWGTVEMDPKEVLERGVAGYLPDMALALDGRSERVGANPLIVRATGVTGRFFKTNATVSDNDAELIRIEDAKTHFLGRCAVIFVVDTDR